MRRGAPVQDLPRRAGLSRVELAVSLGVALLIGAVSLPLLATVRESSRQRACQDRIRQLSRALQDHHAALGRFPAAAYWNVNATQSPALHESRNVARISLDNWAIRVLPYLGRRDLAERFDPAAAIGAERHRAARRESPPELSCPSDGWNRPDNPYAFRLGDEAEAIEFGRGNYAISGGSQINSTVLPSARSAHGEVAVLVVQEEPRVFQRSGNGVAGINTEFRLSDFTNAQSTLIAVEELRSGVHPLDPRGVWALGQIGGSMTFANGVQGDASQPNTPFYRSDDVQGCGALHAAYGTEQLEADGMPCCHYVDVNGQAAARSLHPGGVYAAFVDTSVRFMGDRIDPGLWHVLHARHTPLQVLADAFEQRVTVENFPDAPLPPRGETSAAVDESAKARLTNSLGMWFVRVSAGEFRMGVPDQGNDFEPPPESPAHTVRITRDYWLGDREVTRGQYAQVMGLAQPEDAPATQPEHVQDVFPMTEVTWEQAVEFCRRLGALPEELTAGRTYRLPTEAEWEFACRARTSAPYRWRSKRQPGDVSGEAAGIDPPLPLSAVGSYPPNALGLYDLRGNAWEWCADWFDRDYYLRSPVDDPQGPGHGYLKVVRGGDWRYVGEPCRHDYAMLPPWLGNPVTGFRVVCERGVSQPRDRPAPQPDAQR